MGAGKSKRAGKYGTKKSKERREGLSRRSLLFFEPYFSARLDFEDENHFLSDCKAYSQIRDIFFSKLETKIPDFKSLSHDTLISLLMNSSDYLINCQLVSFISQSFELRTKLISMTE